MAAEDSPEDLPQGWTPHFDVLKSGRKVKYYMNSGTGQKFYSKADLMRYVKAQNHQLDQPQPTESPVERPSNNNQMHLIQYTNKCPEWLPHGWIVELITRKAGVCKCYVDPSTGRKYYSKPQVFRHLKTMNQKSSTSKQKEMPKSIVPASKLIEYTNERPEWLPHGWIMEIKNRRSGPARGKKYKIFVDPSTGCKFFSKPEVFRYLKTVKNKSSTSEQKEMPMSIVPTSQVTTGKSSSEDLPPGWIKEIKIRQTPYKTKKDPFYTDPESGYVFRSKRDVHRYLETGDINACAILPRKRDIEDKSLPPSSTKRRKLEHPVTSSHQLFGENGSSDVGSMASRGAYSLRKRGTKTESALTTLPEAITVDISSQRSPRSDDTDSKENSNKNWSPPPKAEDLGRNEDKNTSAMIKRERYPTRYSLSKSKHQKGLNMPRRCSNRLAGFEPDVVINSLSIVQLSSEVDKKQGKNSGSGTKAIGSYETKTQNSLTKSKKALTLPLRSSKRLAGFGPEQVADSAFIVQALPKTYRPPNDEATMAVGLNKDVMTKSEPRKELELHTSSDANNTLLGEPSNESQGCDTTSQSSGRSQVEMINADNLPILTPEADMKQENYLDSVNKQRNENNSRASRKKKEFNLPRRSSKRLASTEPETKANSVSVPDGLLDEAQTPKLIPAEHGLETPRPSHGEPGEPSNNQPFLDAHAGSEDKLQTVEVNKSDDKKSESEFIPPLGEILSDPCLEFAFKTLTGELPVEIPVSTPAADITSERNLTTKKMEKRSIKGKAPISSRKSKTTKKLGLPHQASEFQPEPVATPITKGRAFKNRTRLSNKTGVVLGTTLAPYSSAVAPEAQQVHHDYGNGDKPEQPPFFSFGNYCSDPSFESAFETIAGSAPGEDNIPDKSNFQQQAEPSQIRREGYSQQQSEISQSPKGVSSTLPDYGFPSFFHTDLSVHLESREQRLSSQPQMPVKNNPILSSGSVNFSSFSGIGGGFSSFSGISSQPPAHIKKSQPFSSSSGIGSQPPPHIKKNQPSPLVKKNRGRGRPRKVNS